MTDEQIQAKTIPQSEFSNDDGTPDAELQQILELASQSQADRYAVQRAVVGARVFVPVLAILDSEEVSESGQRVEKDSHMATVSVQRSDGRKGLLAFSSLDRMQAWNQESRPVAALGPTVGASAIQEGATAIIFDYGHPHSFVLEGSPLGALAKGQVLSNPLLADETMSLLALTLEPISKAQSIQFEVQAGTGLEDVRLLANFLPEVWSEKDSDDRHAALVEVAQLLEANVELADALPGGVALAIRR